MKSILGSAIIKCVLTFELVSLLIAVGSSGELDAETLFYLRLRPRLGHFPDVDGYLSIFEDYFDSTIRLNDKKLSNLDVNDWRKVRPTGELCVDFLQGFQVKRYKLSKPYGIIALDACLGWLFDKSDEKEEDLKRFTVATRAEAENIAKDKKLAAIYEATAFQGDKVPQKTKDAVHEYLHKLLKVYADNPRSGCHGLWLETYTDFIEDVYLENCDDEENCEHFGGYDEATKDSYLSLIVDSTKQSSITCYGVMQKQIKRIMRQAYEAEMAVSAKLSKKIKAATTRVDKQSETMMWGKSMIRILQLVTGTDPETPISLEQVVKDLNKLRINDDEAVERFTTAVGKYAIQNVNLKDSANDPEGRARFGKAVTKLCKPYINPQIFLAQTGGSTLWQDPSENKNPFEFYNIVYGLIRLTNHQSIYRISKDKFENDVLTNKWEALYLTTFACQLISITWGELDYDTNEEAYSVSFRPNEGEDLIEDWPLHVMLAKIKDDELAEPEQHQPAPQVSQQQQQPQATEPQVAVAPPQAPAQVQGPPQQPQPVAAEPVPHAHRPAEKQDRLFSSFKFNLFSKNKSTRQRGPAVAPAAPVAPSQPAPAPAAPAPQPVEAPKKPIMSLEAIEMFKNLHGRYPSGLPANIHEIYPSLPKNLDGHYPKTLGVQKPKPQPTPKPAPKPVPKPKPQGGDFSYNPYGQSYGFGGETFDFDSEPAKKEPQAPKRKMNLVF